MTKDAAQAEKVLRHYCNETGTDGDDALSMLLFDLMAWADENQVDFAHELKGAQHHYGRR